MVSSMVFLLINSGSSASTPKTSSMFSGQAGRGYRWIIFYKGFYECQKIENSAGSCTT